MSRIVTSEAEWVVKGRSGRITNSPLWIIYWEGVKTATKIIAEVTWFAALFSQGNKRTTNSRIA